MRTKIRTIVSISALALSLTACGPAAVDHASGACDAYDSVFEATNGSDLDAIITANAVLIATLSVWQTDGGESDELYGKLGGYARALQGFLMTASPEDARVYTGYQDAEGGNIDALCSAARG